MKTVTTLVLLVALTLVSGCGRRGDPLRPSEAAAQLAKEEKRPAPEKPVPNEKNKDKEFVLDGLLD